MLEVTRWVVRALIALNLLVTALLLGLLAASFAFETGVLARLARGFPAANAAEALNGARWALLLVAPAGAAAHVVFTRLLRILTTVSTGDPFVDANGRRLQAIAWAMLVLQLCDAFYGVVGTRVDLALGERVSGWSPSVTGWLAVLLLFVLARIFREGARMRDDLALTV